MAKIVRSKKYYRDIRGIKNELEKIAENVDMLLKKHNKQSKCSYDLIEYKIQVLIEDHLNDYLKREKEKGNHRISCESEVMVKIRNLKLQFDGKLFTLPVELDYRFFDRYDNMYRKSLKDILICNIKDEIEG